MTLSPQLESWLLANADRRGEPLGAGYQASVIRLDSPEGELAVKRARDSLLLGWLWRRMLRREYAAYRALAAVPGVPAAAGLTRSGWLVLEFVDGRSLRDAQHSIEDREQFYGRLLDTIQAMHAAGVAHGDLKRKDNVIVGPGDEPYLIDFGIARVRGRSAIDTWLFRLTRQLDLNAWIKLKHGRRPEDLPAGDAALHRPLPIERLARWIRVPWQTLTLRRPRQRLRAWLAARRGD